MVSGALLLERRGAPPGGIDAGAGGSAIRGTTGDIDALRAAVRRTPDDAGALAALGLEEVRLARLTYDPSAYPRAEQALRRALSVDPTEVDAMLGMGALSLGRHEFDDARRWGRLAVASDPYDADSYGVLGDAQLELGRYREAFGTYQEMVDTEPDLASYARVSYARELQGDVRGATSAMEAALGAAGAPADAAWAAFQVGELRWNAGDVAGAAAWYRRALGQVSDHVPSLAGLARVAWARGRLDEAIRRLEAVVDRYPAPEFVVALTDLETAAGREAEARRFAGLVRAQQRLAAESGVNVDLELALFDADHGRPGAALDAARAEWERRKSVHVADALAWALHVNGRDAEARAYALRALRLGTRNALFLFHAGMIELGLGKDAAARRLIRRALAVNPNFSILHSPTAVRVLDGLGGRG
jgi:tetratricopeptide (TPR) repeat protein